MEAGVARSHRRHLPAAPGPFGIQVCKGWPRRASPSIWGKTRVFCLANTSCEPPRALFRCLL